MLSNCSKCRKKRESENLRAAKTKGKPMLLSKCAAYDRKKQDLSKNKKLVDY